MLSFLLLWGLLVSAPSAFRPPDWTGRWTGRRPVGGWEVHSIARLEKRHEQTPDTPCMAYMPTLGWFQGSM